VYRAKLINHKSAIATRLSSIAMIEFLNNIVQVEEYSCSVFD